jgi:hypothetical protein
MTLSYPLSISPSCTPLIPSDLALLKMSSSGLSKDHIAAIGELVVNMTRIDSVVVDLLSIFMGTSIINAIVAFYPVSFSSKMDTLKALISLSMEDDDERKADPTITLLNKVSDLGDFRNKMVHAYWTIAPDGTTKAVRFPTRGGKFSRSVKPLTSTEILEKAIEARATEQLLRGLRDHLLEHQRKTAAVKEVPPLP